MGFKSLIIERCNIDMDNDNLSNAQCWYNQEEYKGMSAYEVYMAQLNDSQQQEQNYGGGASMN